MSRPAILDVRHLPDLAPGSRAPIWWGMVLLLLIESAVFGTLITSYFYLRLGQPEWPPPGIDPPDLMLPTINTGILLASSIPMYLADHGISRGRVRQLIWGMLGSIALGVLFLVLKVVEYAAVPYRGDDHAYGAIVWLIIGFHSAHVASVVLKSVVVAILAAKGFFDAERLIGVQVNGLYWHFVVGVWVPLYLVLYWAPRVLQ